MSALNKALNIMRSGVYTENHGANDSRGRLHALKVLALAVATTFAVGAVMATDPGTAVSERPKFDFWQLVEEGKEGQVRQADRLLAQCQQVLNDTSAPDVHALTIPSCQAAYENLQVIDASRLSPDQAAFMTLQFPSQTPLVSISGLRDAQNHLLSSIMLQRDLDVHPGLINGFMEKLAVNGSVRAGYGASADQQLLTARAAAEALADLGDQIDNPAQQLLDLAKGLQFAKDSPGAPDMLSLADTGILVQLAQQGSSITLDALAQHQAPDSSDWIRLPAGLDLVNPNYGVEQGLAQAQFTP
ncbi:MAG: hypothetical protein IBX50_08275 [Marinospirillum sp.]|uniref:hypothetical protein n=1 Tax=Marinospirillum sp. TaxID=2183934 RepID=UPI001A07697D|nr:hypothetical protein [Marinospirillum sp.]MBE0506702.1 hypothetical protein [Marinospirillum sp.]